LILLDLMLPKLDGFALLKILKDQAETKDIPVIVLSNLGQEDSIAKAVELGIVDYTVKATVDLEDVIDKIKKYLV